MCMQESIHIELSATEREELTRIANSPSQQNRLVERAKIILDAANGYNHRKSARHLSVTRKTIKKWRQRYLSRRLEYPDARIITQLVDADRTGCPPKFDAFFWVDVTAIATSEPQQSGRPITEWTHQELADEVCKRKLTDSIHPSTVGRFLAECALKPHRVMGWMNRKDDPEFEQRATEVKECLVRATSATCPDDEAYISYDEKTGMQAKQRIAPDHPMKPGQPKRLEFEYKRNGTLALLAVMIVGSGMIMGCTRTERTNEVTAEVMNSFFKSLFASGYKRIHVLLDQLNTHWSVALVHVVAAISQVPIPAPSEIKEGRQRRAWLSDPNKAIVFHFTPKHASWLNPIEIWFGVLVRKLLRHGSFASTDELAQKVAHFTEYYNSRMAHPYKFKRWLKAA